MKRYADRSGESGIAAYEPGAGFIVIRFKHGGTYRYDGKKPGRRQVAAMKKLAENGEGLATYINRFVRENYGEKLDDP